jgi:hypothetical protein
MKIWAFILAGATFGYIALLAWRGAFLIATGDPVLIAFGAAIGVFPLLGLWFLWRELRFGFIMQAMGRAFIADPDVVGGWQEHYRTALEFDALRERRKAREAMREAARLFRSTS